MVLSSQDKDVQEMVLDGKTEALFKFFIFYKLVRVAVKSVLE